MTTTIGEALRGAARRFAFSRTAMLDARLLMKAATGYSDARLIADEHEVLAASAQALFDGMVTRRARHEPVAHIVGWRDFYGLRIETAPGLLVPRADSETLIETARTSLARDRRYRILDLGAGSGALLCALLSIFPYSDGVGVEIDEKAAVLARRNLKMHGLSMRGRMVVGDWACPLGAQFDLIVANPPYIPTHERDGLPAEVRDYESPGALFAGADGLDAYRSILASMPAIAAPGALIVLEIGDGQAPALTAHLRDRMAKASWRIMKDLNNAPRALTIQFTEQ